MRIIVALLLVFVAFPSLAIEKKLGASNTFTIKLVDSAGAPVTGKTLANIAVHWYCPGKGAVGDVDETGDTLTEVNSTKFPGVYTIATNDTLGCSAEDEVIMSATGTGLDPQPIKVKNVANIESDTKADSAAILLDTGTDGVVLANDAITAAKIAADAITSSELATTAAQEITDDILDEALSSHRSAGSVGKKLGDMRR